MDLTMQDISPTLKADYRFTKDNEALLLMMKPHMEIHADEFIDGFYEFIKDFGKTAEFLKNDEVIARHRDKVRHWYADLFSGDYDSSYFHMLYKVGEVHFRLGLPTHYVNAAFNYVRVFILGRIHEQYADDAGLKDKLIAVERLLDINLDILTLSYREGEMSRFLSLSPIEKTLLSSLKKIASYFNYILAGALVLVAASAIGLFGYDVYLLFSGHTPVEKGILTILGSLLILWAAIELIHEEMKHLRGGSFALEAFIGLAIAALIRKILIFSLSTANALDVLIYGVLVLCLGISYWLVVVKVNPEKK